MESPNRQAVKLLREQRKRRNRAMAFLGMAGLVAIGTVMALRLSGHAMNDLELDCVLAHDLPHQHSEECYYTPTQEGAQELLVCGMADFVVHKHDPQSCFDENGNLVCMLPEIEEHVHTEECYQEQRVLSCGLQEGDGGHSHTELCYGPDLFAEPICSMEEAQGHTHDETCHDEDGQIVCGQDESEAHIHTDSCYPVVLTCDLNEGDGGHVHSEACYTTEATAICGKREVQLHTHTEECYLHTVDQPDQLQIEELSLKGIDVDQAVFASSEEAPSEENRVLDSNGMPVLKCGQLQVLEHVHDDSCSKLVDPEGDLASQLGSDSIGVDMPGQRTAVYQDSGLRVTAVYDGEDFPENARVSVERVDENEGLMDKQEQLGSVLQDEDLQLKALLKVTVSGTEDIMGLSENIRLTVEPSGNEVVAAAAWNDAGSGLEEQGVYMQSVKPELELLSISEHESGVYATEIAPGAVVGVVLRQPVEEDDNTQEKEKPEGEQAAVNTVLSVSQAFEYEDDDYMMVFHIDGIARFKPTSVETAEVVEPEEEENTTEPEPDPDIEPEPEDEPENTGITEDVYFTDDQPDESQDAEEEPVPTPEPEPEPSTLPSLEEEPVEEFVTIAGDTLPANVLDDPENPLGLMVGQVAEDSPEFELYSDFNNANGENDSLPGLMVMSYSLYYKGAELDLSECAVTLEVTVKEKLLEAAAELEEMQSSMAAEDAELSGIAVLTLVPVDEPEEAAEDEEVYSMPATSEMLSQVDIETKILGIANEGISSDSPVVADAAVILSEAEGAQTAVSVLRKAGSSRDAQGGTDVSRNNFGLTALTADNPHFTVEYYALLNVVDKEGSALSVIDTSGGLLPQNGDPQNANTNSPMGLDLVDGKVKTKQELRTIYTKMDSYYIQRPNLSYFVPASAAQFYDLKQIWVGDSESDKDSSEGWTVYGVAFGGVTVSPENKIEKFHNFHFTNRDPNTFETSDTKDKYVQIKEGSVIRLIYEPNSGTKSEKANFYDYDIMKKEGESIRTFSYGINQYNGTNEYQKSDGIVRYAFGNENAGTNYGTETWNGNMLNKANNDKGYGKCTFQIVTGIDAAGNVIFNDKIDGPNLFGSGYQEGRTEYLNNKLEFTRSGDTYTLTSASVGNYTLNNLNTFSCRFYHNKWTLIPNHPPTLCTTGECRVVASNDFWPLDNEQNGDPHFGALSSNLTFDNTDKEGGTSGEFPRNDDGREQNHNSYFGMNFSVIFELTTEYAGPLEYLFFGDDDMWVFLTQVDKAGNPIPGASPQLICDIGGVHPSVGEYVDLWDYVGKDKGTKFEKNTEYVTTQDDETEHGVAYFKLDFFYTERGASGSTCWMQYTLPSVRSATSIQTEDMLRQLEIKKEVTKTVVSGEFGDGETELYGKSEDEFLFKLTLKNDDDTALKDSYSYIKYKADGTPYENKADGSDLNFVENLLDPEIVWNGAYFTLKHGEYIKIDHLPKGTKFSVTECGVLDHLEVKDGKIEFITKEGEHEYEVSASIKQGNGEYETIGPASENQNTFSGEVKDNVSASILFDNNFKTYWLPETGGTGTWGFTGAGALMLLAAGCLLVRKRVNRS